jgi:hypothetical protein
VFGGVPIAESVVVTWVIMAVLLVLSLILVRNLKVENPGKKQLLLESGVSFLLNFFDSFRVAAISLLGYFPQLVDHEIPGLDIRLQPDYFGNQEWYTFMIHIYLAL